MKQKALGMAVAAALSTPALVLAQASTVQIYGQARIDYQKVDQGAGLKKPDAFSSYDSYIGFRGEEKLGGGVSAWFQCESTLNPAGEENDGNGWCTRNTGVGLKGAWGNIFFGNWDTPYKIVHGSVYRPFSTAGAFGNANLLHNGTGGHVANGALGSPLASSGTAVQAAGFSRRQINTINFHSGNYAGFQVLAQVSASDESTSLTNGAAPTSKPRLYSIGATYTAGPLYVGAGYDHHKAYNPGLQTFGTAPGDYADGTDRAWEIVAAYTAGPVRIGASYHDKSYEVASPATGPLAGGGNRKVKHKAWSIYANWRIVGPHSLRLGYIHADDVKGDGTVNVNNLTAPRVAATGAAVGDTGANLYVIQYAYAFSKRTEVNFGYAKLDNDRNARYVLQNPAARNTCQGVPGAGTVPPAAASCDRNQDAIVLGVIHRF